MNTDRLPWDTARLEDSLAVLRLALARWQGRDESRPQADVRHAANDALAAIDELLRCLYPMRGRLVGEVRAADAANDARVDRLLAGREDADG